MVAVEDLTREFWNDLITYHMDNVTRLTDAYERDELYGARRWEVRMWFDISEFILMSFPDEDLHETITKIKELEQIGIGHVDYREKFSLYIDEHVRELSRKYSV